MKLGINGLRDYFGSFMARHGLIRRSRPSAGQIATKHIHQTLLLGAQPQRA